MPDTIRMPPGSPSANGRAPPPSGMVPELVAPPAIAIDAVSNCRLPPFWRANPDLWFFQVEAAFEVHRVQGDSAKMNLVIGKLDPDTIQVVADVLRSRPAANRYESLKTVILKRLTDSADRQLHKLLTQLELGDRKPSQLLREMRSLAGNRVSDDVSRVKWLDLLPSTACRLLTIFKAPNLDVLARAADELVDSDPSVTAAGYPSQQASTPSPTPSRDPLAGELAAQRQTLSQLIVLTRENLERSRRHGDQQHSSRSQSRSPGRQRGRSTSANAGA